MFSLNFYLLASGVAPLNRPNIIIPVLISKVVHMTLIELYTNI